MTAQEVKFANFFETTLNGVLASGSSSATLTAAPTSNGTSIKNTYGKRFRTSNCWG